MKLRRILPAFIVLAAAAAGACSKSSPSPIYCTAEARPGIQVTVVDSLTNQAALFTGFWLRARDGNYVDSQAVSLGDVQKGQVSVPLAYERAGVYAVAVKADGYQLWTKSNVLVTGDACHVTTVQLTARLAK